MITVNHESDGATSQYIKFRASNQDFAASIMAVREIRGWSDSTPIPSAPDYVRGAINLRGLVLPVVDLKARLGGGLTEANPSTVIVVVDTAERTIGILVDAVLDILSVAPDQVQEVPDIARHTDNAYVDGVAVIEGKLVTLLDMKKLIGALN